jgi:hypothetical protein
MVYVELEEMPKLVWMCEQEEDPLCYGHDRKREIIVI